MLNITQGNPVPLGIQLRRNGADFAPESEGLRVLLTDYYGSRAIEDVSAGSITGIAWNATKDNSQNTINSVIKIFVRGEYGVAVKAVEHPDNEQ